MRSLITTGTFRAFPFVFIYVDPHVRSYGEGTWQTAEKLAGLSYVFILSRPKEMYALLLFSIGVPAMSVLAHSGVYWKPFRCRIAKQTATNKRARRPSIRAGLFIVWQLSLSVGYRGSRPIAVQECEIRAAPPDRMPKRGEIAKCQEQSGCHKKILAVARVIWWVHYRAQNRRCASMDNSNRQQCVMSVIMLHQNFLVPSYHAPSVADNPTVHMRLATTQSAP